MTQTGAPLYKSNQRQRKGTGFAILLALLMIISFFLPWVVMKGSVSYGDFSASSRIAARPIDAFGLYIYWFVLSIVALIMAIIKSRVAIIPAAINFAQPVLSFIGVYGNHNSLSYSAMGGSVSGSTLPGVGFWIFAGSTLVYIFATIGWIFKKSNSARIKPTPLANHVASGLASVDEASASPAPEKTLQTLNMSEKMDRLLKAKELLDAGLITKDEFVLMKSQLIGNNIEHTKEDDSPHAKKMVEATIPPPILVSVPREIKEPPVIKADRADDLEKKPKSYTPPLPKNPGVIPSGHSRPPVRKPEKKVNPINWSKGAVFGVFAAALTIIMAGLILVNNSAKPGAGATTQAKNSVTESPTEDTSESTLYSHDTPEATVISWVNALGNRDFEYAYSLLKGKQWETGDLRWFSSVDAYGGITGTNILRSGMIENDGATAKVQIQYKALDQANGDGVYEQVFTLFHQNDGWYIQRTKTQSVEKLSGGHTDHADIPSITDAGVMKAVFGHYNDEYAAWKINDKHLKRDAELRDSWLYRNASNHGTREINTYPLFSKQINDIFLLAFVHNPSSCNACSSSFGAAVAQYKNGKWTVKKIRYYLGDFSQIHQQVATVGTLSSGEPCGIILCEAYPADAGGEVFKTTYIIDGDLNVLPENTSFYYTERTADHNNNNMEVAYKYNKNREAIYATYFYANGEIRAAGGIKNGQFDGEWFDKENGFQGVYSNGRVVKNYNQPKPEYSTSYYEASQRSGTYSARIKCTRCTMGTVINGACDLCGTVTKSRRDAVINSVQESKGFKMDPSECPTRSVHSSIQFPYECPTCGYVGRGY